MKWERTRRARSSFRNGLLAHSTLDQHDIALVKSPLALPRKTKRLGAAATQGGRYTVDTASGTKMWCDHSERSD